MRSLFPSEKLKKVLDELKENADALDRACDIAEKELQTDSREVVKGISTELTAERIETAIERAAAGEERKLNAARWTNLDEQQQRQIQYLKELIERQEHNRISMENENAARLRQDRGEQIRLRKGRPDPFQKTGEDWPSIRYAEIRVEAMTCFVV